MRRRLAALVALGAALLLGTAACGAAKSSTGTTVPDITVPSSTTAAPTTSTTVSATADNGQAPAILAAYQGSVTDFDQVATTAPVNPNSPQLAAHMAGEELADITRSLTSLAQAGRVATGGVRVLHASINQYNGSQAVVAACTFDSTALVNAANHQVVTPASNSTELVNALLSQEGGAWKVTKGSQVSPGCS